MHPNTDATVAYLCRSQSNGSLFSLSRKTAISEFPSDWQYRRFLYQHTDSVCVQCVCVHCTCDSSHTLISKLIGTPVVFLFSAFHSRFLSVHHEVTGYKLESPHSAAHVESYGIYRTYLYFAYALNLFSNICVLLQAVWIWSIVSAYSKTFLTAAVWKSCKYGGNIMTETEKNKDVN